MTPPRRPRQKSRLAPRATPLAGERLEPRLALAGTDADFVHLGLVGGPVTAVENLGYFGCGHTDNAAATDFNLCRTDGTLAGTAMIEDVAVGGLSSSPGEMANVNGSLFFVTRNFQLWKSDAATELLKDIEVSAGSVNPLINVNGTLFFSASDGVHGQEIWKSDGMPGGTLMADIRPGADSSYPMEFANVASTLYFTANDGTHGVELWRTDGTITGTRLVNDINPGPGHSNPSYLTSLNGRLLFRADDGTSGNQLWTSDGTTSGTVVIKNDFHTGQFNAGLHSLTNLNGIALFSANDGTHGYELWRTDGTAAGTTLVKDIVGGPVSSNPSNLTKVGNSLFFYAFDGANDGLWKTDGTPSGTSLVAALAPSTDTRYPRPGVNVAGQFFFPFNDGVHGYELWKSDGTASGTVLVADFRPGSEGSYPQTLSTAGGNLFFDATSDGSTYEMLAINVAPPEVRTMATPPPILRAGDGLQITGTPQSDRLTIRVSHGKIVVDGFLNQQPVHFVFAQRGLNRIVANLNDGDDSLKISRDIRARGLIDAGDGNDVVTAGSGSVLIVGGNGDDVLVGSTRRDVLIGGAGKDKLYGGSGSDLLISGPSIYDDDPMGLLAIRAEWASNRSQASRIHNLKNGAGPNLHPLGVKMLVYLDTDPDALYGGNDADYFIYDQKSEMKDFEHKPTSGIGSQLIRRLASPVLGVI